MRILKPRLQGRCCWITVTALTFAGCLGVQAQQENSTRPRAGELTFPPKLPGNRARLVVRSNEFLKPPETLRPNVAIAETAPTIEFLFYPGQDYPGNPWSHWGDSLAINGKYYSSIGDHLAISRRDSKPHGTGTAFVFEYDAATKSLRKLVDVSRVLNRPPGHYTPGKIHTRLDMGRDGWLYFATHRGSVRATTDEYHYQGDWILRTDPRSAQSEIVAHGPVPKHAIPNGMLDPDRLIYYGGTAPAVGHEEEGIRFFAFDVKQKRLCYSGPDGPARAMILARSTGRVYYVPGKGEGSLMRFDPTSGEAPKPLPGTLIGVRAATQETPQGFVYTVSLGQRSADAAIWSFNTQTEETRKIGTVAVGSQAYVATVDADPTGRYLYYVPGAHGGSDRDGTPIVQFDVKTGRKKVMAFLEPYFTRHFGFTLKGTYGAAVDPSGDKLYVTWNVSRGSRAWDCCGMSVIHLPARERQP